MSKCTPQRSASIIFVFMALSACSVKSPVTTTATATTIAVVAPTFPTPSVVEQIPDSARVAVGAGSPRSTSYWVEWSSCGEQNHAETAVANGGAAEGWYLVDDFLGEFGVAVADHSFATCDDAVEVLDVQGSDVFDSLAAQVLAAELNLNSGSETCDAADQSLLVAHQLLAAVGYDGLASIGEEPEPGVDDLVAILATYNAGALCR